MRNELTGQERKAIVRHLLAGCVQCVEVTRRLWSLSAEQPGGALDEVERGDLHPASYREVFTQLAGRGAWGEKRILTERRAAPRLLAELLEKPGRARLGLLRAERRFQIPALCELLVAESGRHQPPAPPVELAELAVGVAEQLAPRSCGTTIVRDLTIRAFAHLGNARRMAGDLRGAEAALAKAEELLGEEEPGDPLDAAELLGLRACLLGDQGKLDDAEPLLDRALALYAEAGERHLQGRALFHKGTLHGRRDGAESALEAIRLVREGLNLLDESRDARLVAAAHHRLVLLLCDAGRPEEAFMVLQRARAMYQGLGDAGNLSRLRRLEGKIEETLGRLEDAEAALIEARQGLLREGLGAETTVVLLELAVLYKRQERWPELRGLAEDLYPIFRARDIGHNEVSALLVFRRLVETEHANVNFLREISHFVAGPPRARRPGLIWTS